MMIDDEAQAGRLARAICADVMLYNPAVKDAPLHERARMISEPLREGRALFATRVSPAWTSVFDAAVAELVAGPLGLDPGTFGKPHVAPVQQTSLAAPVLPQSSGGFGLTIAIAIAVLAGLAAWFLFLR